MAIHSISPDTYHDIDKYQSVSGNKQIDEGRHEQSVKQDLAALSVKEMDIEACGTYENMKSMSCFFNKNRLFYETSSIMQSFYNGEINKEDLKQTIEGYVQGLTGGLTNFQTSYAAGMVKEKLSTVYEYFSRANVRCAVNKNNEEAESYWKEVGCKGSVYYNADYYYKSEEIQEFFRNTLNEIANMYGVDEIDYEALEKNTRFSLDGGLSFNGAWNWSHLQTNHYWMGKSNAIINDEFVPPKDFIYAYGNSLSENDIEGVLKYAKSKQTDNNPDNQAEQNQNAKKLLIEIKYGETFSWGKNSMISQSFEKEKWRFLMPPQDMFGSYFRMLSYTTIE